MGKRNPNKRQKVKLVFDPEERKNFLLGFRKRKMERVMKAQEKMEKKIKEEMTNLREQQKERIAQLYCHDRALPAVEHLIQPIEVIHELDEVVTISAMDTTAIATEAGLIVGENKSSAQDASEEECHEDDDDEDTTARSTQQLQIKGSSVKSLKKHLNKDVVKKMKKVKAFKLKMAAERKKKARSSTSKKRRREKKVGKRKNRPNSRSAS